MCCPCCCYFYCYEGRPRLLHDLAGVQQVSGLEKMLVKTRETFKLADLQFLTARALWEPAAAAAAAIMCCERLVLDSRTGSSLLRLHKRAMLVPDDKDEDDDDAAAAATSFVNGPFSAQIDWIGHILVTASSAAASLVEAIGRQQSQTWALDKPWTLRYLVMSSAAANPSSRKSIKEKPMLCAVAQSIRSPRAALLVDDDDDDDDDRKKDC
jgi:hypothetical protein